jgi:endonuclease G, mitochondrial
VIYLGTGWLFTSKLVMTNHHVVNARNDEEPRAAEGDLALQAKGTLVQFDFDGDAVAGVEVAVAKLEAWDPALDYAVLRIPEAARAPLARAAAPIALGSDPVPVNIIQHPGGRPKRYGIRNNLVSASEATELRYFTDTEGLKDLRQRFPALADEVGA